MNDNNKQEIANIINDSVIDIFKTLFGVEVLAIDQENAHSNDDDLVSKTVLHQEGLDILLSFSFRRDLLEPLLSKIYDSIMAQHESALEDAVCEITNMVAAGVKKHMNESGYHLIMEIPQIDYNFKREKCEENDCINLDYTLNDQTFFVDFKMDQKQGNLE